MNGVKSGIVLIGMPGCGKSTLGKVLAKELNYNYYDMDSYIEEKTNKSISELFKNGEKYFRDIESEVCIELSKKKNCLISSGGGVVKRKENIDVLKQNFILIFIDRPLEEIASDIKVSTRPLLKDGKEKLYSLYNERYELYKNAADITIVNDKYIKDTIDKCKSKLKNLIKS